ncbi:Uu.00g123290.m01.CDS01 [Anthostomella pinea]|uniref:Uu.00g123290.m01.CDS01 n=1 Tax=Anthostomella pinea TaxID=933095 RepID=A0AAI8YHD9_9PEZI|nr:Uu.00g123290.m01.CDS01 [Anthostomella pinea]
MLLFHNHNLYYDNQDSCDDALGESQPAKAQISLCRPRVAVLLVGSFMGRMVASINFCLNTWHQASGVKETLP